MRLLEDGDAGLRGGGQASSQSEDERDCHFLIGAPCVHEPLGMPNKGQTCWINVALQMMMRMGEVFTSPEGHGEKARTLLELVGARGPLSMTVRKRQTTNFLSSWGFRENVAGDAAEGFASIMNGLAGDSAAMATWCRKLCGVRSESYRHCGCGDEISSADCGHGYAVSATSQSLALVLRGEGPPEEQACSLCGRMAKVRRVVVPQGKYLMVALVHESVPGQGEDRVLRSSTAVEREVLVDGSPFVLIGVGYWKNSHWTAVVKGNQEQWFSVDDTRVAAYPGSLSRNNAGLLLYVRTADMDTHNLMLACELPCLGCRVPGCANGLREDLVVTGPCAWLRDQTGLFSRVDGGKEMFVARFGQLLAPARTSEEGQRIRVRLTGGGTVLLAWKRTSAYGLGHYANSTCCAHHANAELIFNGEAGADAAVFVRTTKEVRAGDEILVNYGPAFFHEESCKCCKCTSRC